VWLPISLFSDVLRDPAVDTRNYLAQEAFLDEVQAAFVNSTDDHQAPPMVKCRRLQLTFLHCTFVGFALDRPVSDLLPLANHPERTCDFDVVAFL